MGRLTQATTTSGPRTASSSQKSFNRPICSHHLPHPQVLGCHSSVSHHYSVLFSITKYIKNIAQCCSVSLPTRDTDSTYYHHWLLSYYNWWVTALHLYFNMCFPSSQRYWVFFHKWMYHTNAVLSEARVCLTLQPVIAMPDSIGL